MTPAAQPDQLTLAMERTWLAYERTLMAWIRTATSLIAFGFGLYKFVFFMHEQQPDKAVDHVLGARNLGLVMIGIGIVALGLATLQHANSTRRLRAHFGQAYVLYITT